MTLSRSFSETGGEARGNRNRRCEMLPTLLSETLTGAEKERRRRTAPASPAFAALMRGVIPVLFGRVWGGRSPCCCSKSSWGEEAGATEQRADKQGVALIRADENQGGRNSSAAFKVEATRKANGSGMMPRSLEVSPPHRCHDAWLTAAHACAPRSSLRCLRTPSRRCSRVAQKGADAASRGAAPDGTASRPAGGAALMRALEDFGIQGQELLCS